MPSWGSTPLRALFREIHRALPEKGSLAKKHETARPVRNEQIRSVEREVIFRTPHDQLGQERHRPEGLIRPELSTSRRLRPAVADFAATTQPSSRSRSASGLAPQAKVFAYSVVSDRNPVGSDGGEAAGEEGRGTFVVGIPSDRSVCTKQVLVEVEAVGGFTPAGKPPPQLLGRSGIRSYGLVSCA